MSNRYSHAHILARYDDLGLTEFDGTRLPAPRVIVRPFDASAKHSAKDTRLPHAQPVVRTNGKTTSTRPPGLATRTQDVRPSMRGRRNSSSSQWVVLSPKREGAAPSQQMRPINRRREADTAHALNQAFTSDSQLVVGLSGHGPDGMLSAEKMRRKSRSSSFVTEIHMPMLSLEPDPFLADKVPLRPRSFTPPLIAARRKSAKMEQDDTTFSTQGQSNKGPYTLIPKEGNVKGSDLEGERCVNEELDLEVGEQRSKDSEYVPSFRQSRSPSISTRRSSLSATTMGQIKSMAASMSGSTACCDEEPAYLKQNLNLPLGDIRPAFLVGNDEDLESLPSPIPSEFDRLSTNIHVLEPSRDMLFGIPDDPHPSPASHIKIVNDLLCSRPLSVDSVAPPPIARRPKPTDHQTPAPSSIQKLLALARGGNKAETQPSREQKSNLRNEYHTLPRVKGEAVLNAQPKNTAHIIETRSLSGSRRTPNTAQVSIPANPSLSASSRSHVGSSSSRPSLFSLFSQWTPNPSSSSPPKALPYSKAIAGEKPRQVAVCRTGVPSIPALFPEHEGPWPPDSPAGYINTGDGKLVEIGSAEAEKALGERGRPQKRQGLFGRTGLRPRTRSRGQREDTSTASEVPVQYAKRSRSSRNCGLETPSTNPRTNTMQTSSSVGNDVQSSLGSSASKRHSLLPREELYSPRERRLDLKESFWGRTDPVTSGLPWEGDRLTGSVVDTWA